MGASGRSDGADRARPAAGRRARGNGYDASMLTVALSSTEFEVSHVDDALLVVVKPAGLLAVPGRGPDKQDCLSARVQRCYPDARVVHRLDMATSGLMLMARGADAQRRLSHAFATRAIHKRYVAVVAGRLDPPREAWGEIDLPIAADWPRRPLQMIDPACGKPSLTRWRVIGHDAAGGTTRVELEPVTGRSHQLRLHLREIGHPILGDALYAPPHVQALSDRLLLHAARLELPHPTDATPLRFDSTPPF